MTNNIYKNKILILDFGSQYTQLLARRIREIGVYSKIYPWNVTKAKKNEFQPSGIILSGGPHSTNTEHSPRAPDGIFYCGVLVLGICYGMHTMAVQLGGTVQYSSKREFGYAQVKVLKDSLLTNDIKDYIDKNGISLLHVWMSHGDEVTSIPMGFTTVASTKNCQFAIIANEVKRFYGVQFHPEVTHTCQGQMILKRFVFDICGCKELWTASNIIADAKEKICNQVKDDQVILGLSGGIDSSVTAILLHKVIGNRLTCIFIDNGLLRLNEAKQVMEMFQKYYGIKIIYLSMEERFLSALAGIKDPETKRKIIGQVFIEVFQEQAVRIHTIKWLAQGTIYPDIIESKVDYTEKAQVIKSHHNVGGIPKNMKMGLVEPLKDLFKDEVRKIGLELGLEYEILYRHPFPGPGLGVRIIGEVKKDFCDILRCADAIFIEELKKENLYDQLSQAFTVFLPLRSVGVMGDNRKYDWVISLRAVDSVDFMTANWANLPYDFLRRVSNRIINEVSGISRVVYLT